MTHNELKQLDLGQVLKRLQYACIMAQNLNDQGALRLDPTLPDHQNFRLELGDFVVTARFPDPKP